MTYVIQLTDQQLDLRLNEAFDKAAEKMSVFDRHEVGVEHVPYDTGFGYKDTREVPVYKTTSEVFDEEQVNVLNSHIRTMMKTVLTELFKND